MKGQHVTVLGAVFVLLIAAAPVAAQNLSCPESGGCWLVQDVAVSHFTLANCQGEELFYVPNFPGDPRRRSWDGRGFAGTTSRTATTGSVRHPNGNCENQGPFNNSGFVKIYRERAAVPVDGKEISHFSGTNCTGQELAFTRYNSADQIRRSWDGKGIAGTFLTNATTRSWKRTNGTCENTVELNNPDFVRIYR
jgi:hypothetical protein